VIISVELGGRDIFCGISFVVSIIYKLRHYRKYIFSSLDSRERYLRDCSSFADRASVP
jgi:hypothetical protein